MSHITRVRTIMKIRRHIVAAMTDAGYPPAEPEGEGPLVYRHFRFEPGAEAWNLVVDADRDVPDVRPILQRYAYRVARETLEAQGFALAHEERQADGQVHLVLRRMG